MSKTRISMAVLSAFALGAAAPLFAAESTSSGERSSSADPPAGERIPAAPGSPQTSGDTSSRAEDPAAAATPSAPGAGGEDASSGETVEQTEVRPQPSAPSSEPADASGDRSGMGHPAVGTRSRQAQQAQDRSELDHPALDGAQAGDSGDRRASQQTRRQMSGMPGARGDRMQGQDDPYWRQGADAREDGRDQWSAQRRGRSGDMLGRGPGRDARGDYRYYRGDRDWDAMGEFDERDRMPRGPEFWRDIDEGSGYTYREDYYNPSARGDYYGPSGGGDYYSERENRWRGRSGDMMGRGSDYRDEHSRDYRDRRDYYSERDRYYDERAGRGGARGRWDDRGRGAPGDRMGRDPSYPDYESAVPRDRAWRDRGDWRDSGQWRDGGRWPDSDQWRGGRWHGDQWSGGFDARRPDMGPGGMAGRDWGRDPYRQGQRGGDWRGDQWQGSSGAMGGAGSVR